MSDYLDEVFGKDGLFAARFPGYEMRDGQVALSRIVDQAMREERHALGEGPCGTGKGVAYGVPAVYHAHHHKKRVVIATANIALQEQLVTKDLPMLAEVLPWKFSFALLKGRNNYWCSDRAAESEGRGELSGLYDDEQDRQMDAVLAWAKGTATGDMSELSFVPLPQVWSKVSVTSDECKGEECRFRETCFSERAKETAKAADIVVTNYHLLFAHLAVRRETGQDLVLPSFDLLVLDEAHEAAEIARDFFGFSVSEHSVGRLARYAADFGDKKLADRLRREAEAFFSRVASFARSPAYRRRLKTPGFADTTTVVGELRVLASKALARVEDEGLEREKRATARNAYRLATTAAERITEAVQQADPGKVYWIDLDGKGRARLKAKPVDVSAVLRAELFEQTDSVTLVSATLTAAGTFDFVRREVGVPDGALEVVAETPFDFERQALLIVPEGLPDPREPTFVGAVAEVVRRVIELCNGRTLGLFTSYKNLNAVYERVVGNGHRVLRQGELPRAELTRIFKEDISSVLLGTDSFWTGIDVPGEALTGLVIDKLPFPHPEDPVIDAICERDPRAFQNYLVPKAIITLRQGVGRLIRSQKDVGVVVLLDRRIAEKAYGRQFLKSLPPMLTTRRLENISRFLEEAGDARAG
ncbi:MAG: DEAD/DEAH box helicase family protein [Myxococcales bacterium]|nr:DEAD/DEAH box helicase family protein [Myxococcales bacterium]